MPKNRGWECPGCGRCYAPWVAECKHCPEAKMTTASTKDANDWEPTDE